MLSHQRVALFQRTRGIRCGLVGIGVVVLEELLSLKVGFEVSKAHARNNLSLLTDQNVVLNYSNRVCLHATMFPIMVTMN